MTGAEIARHIIPAGRGVTVTSDSHKRDTSMKIGILAESVTELFTDKELMTVYLARIKDRYGRYMRDQLIAISNACTGREQEDIDNALDCCVKRGLFSANDFKAAISGSESRVKETEKPVSEYKPVGDERTRAIANFKPATSNLAVYEGITAMA